MKRENSTVLNASKSNCISFFNKLLFENEGKNELCFVCQLIVDDVNRHVREVHAKLPLFKCPHCPFYSTWNDVQVGVHLIAVHDDLSPLSLVDNCTHFSLQLQEWMNKCFGLVEPPAAVATNLLPLSSSSDHPATATSSTAAVELKSPTVAASDSAKLPCTARLCHWMSEKDVIEPDQLIPSSVSAVVAQKTAAVPKKSIERRVRPRPALITCRLCGTSRSCFKTALVHLYRSHLKEPTLFACQLCAYTHSCDRVTANQHSVKVHKDKSAIVSRENEFKDVIDALKIQCFGGPEQRPESAAGSLPDFEQKATVSPELQQEIRSCSYQTVLTRSTFISSQQMSEPELVDLTSVPEVPLWTPSPEVSRISYAQLSPSISPVLFDNPTNQAERLHLENTCKLQTSDWKYEYPNKAPVILQEKSKSNQSSAPYDGFFEQHTKWTANGWYGRSADQCAFDIAKMAPIAQPPLLL